MFRVARSLTRANKPLAAAMTLSTDGTGLTTADINKWLSEIFRSPSRPDFLNQYSVSVPVYFAVSLRAEAVARARMKAYTESGMGELQWVGSAHPVQKHLDRVNPWWSHADIWRAVETYLCLYGSSFRWIDKKGSDPSEWEQWVLRPDKVVVVKDKKKYIRGFIYDPHGANFAMLPDEVLWDRYFNPMDEFSGLSPLESLKTIIPMREEMITANRAMFKNGVLAQNLVYAMKGPLTSEQVEDFYTRLEQRYAGGRNANRPIVVDLGVGDVKTLSLSNREMEWGQGLRWAAGDILTAFKVREELYPGSQRTTYHNLGEALQDFYRNTVSSEWEMIQSGMDERFLTMLPARYQNLVFRFDVTTVAGMQESINDKSTRELNEVQFGVRTPNEYRADRGLAPLPDGMGDKPYVPSGTIPLEMLGETEPQPQLPAPEEEDDEPRMVSVVRCPDCKKLTGKGVLTGSKQWCRRCKSEFTVDRNGRVGQYS